MLLDWGQCKALTAARQRALAQLVVALDRGWTLGIVAAMSGMGLSFLAKVSQLKLERLLLSRRAGSLCVKRKTGIEHGRDACSFCAGTRGCCVLYSMTRHALRHA